jgi:hypothetical protein
MKISTNGKGVTWDIFPVNNNESEIRDINGTFYSDDDALEYVRGLSDSGDKEACAAIEEVEGK